MKTGGSSRARPSRRLDPDALLLAGAELLGLAIDPPALDRFRRYREELVRWSERVNLTALRQPAEIVRQGFLDSLACAPLIPAGTKRIVDIGSGAGFPAIPLAIVRREVAFTLVEATRKKVTFLRQIARTIDLSLAIIHARAEALKADPAHAGAYDLALARAVAPLADQARLVRPLLRPGGAFLAQLGAVPAGAEETLGALGFRVERSVTLPASIDPGRHILVLRACG